MVSNEETVPGHMKKGRFMALWSDGLSGQGRQTMIFGWQIRKALGILHEVALKEGCTTNGIPMYLNITLESISARDIYRDNYDDLKRLRNNYDPANVMGAGGWIYNLT